MRYDMWRTSAAAVSRSENHRHMERQSTKRTSWISHERTTEKGQDDG